MAPTDSSQETLRRRGLRLAWFIVVWDIIEGAVAVTAGVLAGSIALVAFGLDSAIEVFAALVVIGQLHGRTSYGTALKLIAVSFFVLATYVTTKSIIDLVSRNQAEGSWIGIGLNCVALVVMVPVAIAQRRTGEALQNQVLVAQSKETWISNYLSISVLIGLGANALLGWWWADPVAALVISAVAVREGREAWRGAGESSR